MSYDTDFGLKGTQLYPNNKKTNIIGIGVDIVEVERISDAVRKWGKRFIDRIWTSQEIDYCTSKYNPNEHFAARFAGKEAVSKSLGITWVNGVNWKEINITRDPLGIPEVKLSGEAMNKAEELHITNILLSMSHCSLYAIAYAIIIN